MRGPRKSPRIPTETLNRSATQRTRSTSGFACSAERCEKFSRTTSIPASIRRASISSLSLAGPIVATILVLFAGRAMIRTVAQSSNVHKTETIFVVGELRKNQSSWTQRMQPICL
jgi:hypothetical protein